MISCKKCLYKKKHPLGLHIQSKICSGCFTHLEKYQINWAERKEILLDKIQSIIKKNIDILYPIQIPDEKNAYTQKEIYKVSKKIKLKTVSVSNLSTINRLLLNSSNEYILVTGSLYLIGKIRKKYL